MTYEELKKLKLHSNVRAYTAYKNNWIEKIITIENSWFCLIKLKKDNWNNFQTIMIATTGDNWHGSIYATEDRIEIPKTLQRGSFSSRELKLSEETKKLILNALKSA